MRSTLPAAAYRWLVSNVVSFAWVRRRPPGRTRYGQPRSRTVADAGERWSALLESVLGATPREFESRILRHYDLQEHPHWQPSAGPLEFAWSHLVVSVVDRRWCHSQDQPPLLCLVTDVPDRPEQRGARRRGVLVASPGSLAVPANLAVRI
jgi:hypothetical protein